MTDDSASLRALAAQCRSLSRGVSTRDVAHSLQVMADDYERKAQAAEAKGEARPPAPPAEAG